MTDQDIFTAMSAFLASILPAGTPIIQAQQNGVPMPQGAFVAMNNAGQYRLSTNTDTYSEPGTKTAAADLEYIMQLDFYGPLAATWASTACILFRDSYAVDMFPANIVPLHADEMIQMPLIDGEQRYEQRWTVRAHMHVTPVVTVTQDFATSLAVTLASVDVLYHQ